MIALITLPHVLVAFATKREFCLPSCNNIKNEIDMQWASPATLMVLRHPCFREKNIQLCIMSIHNAQNSHRRSRSPTNPELHSPRRPCIGRCAAEGDARQKGWRFYRCLELDSLVRATTPVQHVRVRDSWELFLTGIDRVPQCYTRT